MLRGTAHGAAARAREQALLLEFAAADFMSIYRGVSGADVKMQHAIHRNLLQSLARSNSQLSRLVTQARLGEDAAGAGCWVALGLRVGEAPATARRMTGDPDPRPLGSLQRIVSPFSSRLLLCVLLAVCSLPAVVVRAQDTAMPPATGQPPAVDYDIEIDARPRAFACSCSRT